MVRYFAHFVIASEVKQSRVRGAILDCFVACAPLLKRFAFVAGNDGDAGFNVMALIGRLFVIFFGFLASPVSWRG